MGGFLETETTANLPHGLLPAVPPPEFHGKTIVQNFLDKGLKVICSRKGILYGRTLNMWPDGNWVEDPPVGQKAIVIDDKRHVVILPDGTETTDA